MTREYNTISLLHRVIVVGPSHQVLYYDSPRQSLLQEINQSKSVDFDESSLVKEESKSVGEQLHDIADLLPQKAIILDVVLNLDDSQLYENDNIYLGLYSALKRLSSWHNAKISYIGRHHGLGDIVSMTSCQNVDEAVDNSDWWRGKIAIASKEGSRRVHLGGLSLSIARQGNDDSSYSSLDVYLTHTRHLDKDKIEFSRTIQLLEQVKCAELPPFYFLPHVLQITQYTHHPSTTAFLDILRDEIGIGYFARLGYSYKNTKKERLCGSGNLSTKVWKESIMSNITAVNEPDESMPSICGYLHFLITTTKEQQCVAYLLRSPWELNPNTIRSLCPAFSLDEQPSENMQGSISLDNSDSDSADNMLSDPSRTISLDDSFHQRFSLDDSYIQENESGAVPYLEREFLDILPKLADVEMDIFRKWTETELNKGNTAPLSRYEIVKFVSGIRHCLQKRFRTNSPYDVIVEEAKSPQTDQEVDLKQTAEYHSLSVREKAERILERYRSLDGVPMSSPFTLDDSLNEPTDSSDLRSLFNDDGSARQSASQPINAKTDSGYKKILSEVVELQWPDCKDISYHGINYNRQTEKQEARFWKQGERYVTNETATSLTRSSLSLFNKRPSKAALCRRSSRIQSENDPPRKRNSENMTPVSSNKMSKRRKISNYSAEKKKSTPLSSIRRLSIQSNLGSSSLNQSRTSTSSLNQSNLSSSTLNQSRTSTSSLNQSNLSSSTLNQSRTSTSSLNQSKHSPMNLSQSRTSTSSVSQSRRSSIGLNSSLDGTLSAKQARSHRHTQKLMDVVDHVLLSAGISSVDSLYESCASKLFRMTKIMVMDLPTSVNLRQQMTQIAQSQVDQVVNIAKQKEQIQVNSMKTESLI